MKWDDAPHGVERGLDHLERLVLAGLQLLFLGGVLLGADRAGADHDHVRPARRQRDRIVLEPDGRRRLDPLHAPVVAEQQAPADRAAGDQAEAAHLGGELPARKRLVGRVDPAEPLQVL